MPDRPGMDPEEAGDGINGFSDRLKVTMSERMARLWSRYAAQSRASAPVASFSFDDFPRSAASEGAGILAQSNARATYFVCGARMGRNVEGLEHFTESDLVAVARAGHEIGCHTFTHLRLPVAGGGDIGRDLQRNEEFVRSILGDYRMVSFAYPFGQITMRTKRLLGGRFPICRGIKHGVNSSRIDFAQLCAIPLQQPFDEKTVLQSLDDAVTRKGWVIFFTHDVSDRPSQYGCRPRELERAVRAVRERGIDMLPIREAAERTGLASRARAASLPPARLAEHAVEL